MRDNRRTIGIARGWVRVAVLAALIDLVTSQEECSATCIAQSAEAVGCGAPNYDPIGSQHCICLVCQDAYFPSLESCLWSGCPDYAQSILDAQNSTCSSYRESVSSQVAESPPESTRSDWDPSASVPWWSHFPAVVPSPTPSLTDAEESWTTTTSSLSSISSSTGSIISISRPSGHTSSSSHTSRHFAATIIVGPEPITEDDAGVTNATGDGSQFSSPQHPMIIIGSIFTVLFCLLFLIGLGYVFLRWKRQRQQKQDQEKGQEDRDRLLPAAPVPPPAQDYTPPGTTSTGRTQARPIRHAAEVLAQHSPTTTPTKAPTVHLAIPGSSLILHEWDPQSTHARPTLKAKHPFPEASSSTPLLPGPRPF